MKPEPLNPSQASAPKVAKTPAATNKTKTYKGYGNKGHGNGYGNGYGKKKYGRKSYGRKNYGRRGYKQSSYVTPTQTSQKKYSGAKRKSGYHGYSGKRHWNRRRR